MTSITFLALGLLWVTALAPPSNAGVPETINLQGTIIDATGTPLSGSRDYSVRFFDAQTGGSQLGGDATGTASFGSGGLFSLHLIPSATVIVFSSPWYEIAFDTDTPPDGLDAGDVFSQRVRVNSVPFALKARNSELLGGADSASFATDAELASVAAGLAATPHSHYASDISGEFPDSQLADALTVIGGAVNSTPIGSATPDVGYFTNVIASTATLNNATVTNNLVVGGKITAATICAASASITTASFVSDVTISGTLTVIGGLNAPIFDASDHPIITVSGVTSNQPGDLAGDDFVFGSDQLDDDGNPDHQSRLFFDKSKAAFRAGSATGTQWNEANVGDFSTAFGYRTVASGPSSFAAGYLTAASGVNSTALGYYGYATGPFSTAMGYATYAEGDSSTAMGVYTHAEAPGSTAMGIYTHASDAGSTAMGIYTYGIGIGSTAMGYYTYAVGDYSTSMGAHTFAIGPFTTTSGYGTYAYEPASTAMGAFTYAAGSVSTTMGFRTIATGDYSTAAGLVTYATGFAATSLGHYTIASGSSSTALGFRTAASGDYSLAAGHLTSASGDRSTALGFNTTAGGEASTALGAGTVASAYASTALGSFTTASANSSTSMGNQTIASGFASTAMGRGIEAAGTYSVAIGLNNQNGTVVAQDHTLVVMGGDVGIGSVTPTTRLHVQDDVAGFVLSVTNEGDDDSRDGIVVQAGADIGSGSTDYLLALDGDGDPVGALRNDAGTFSVVDLSDRKSKTNIRDTEVDALALIEALRVVDFNRKATPDGRTIHGFIAQEAQEVFPEMVTQLDEDLLGISKEALIPILTKAVQDLMAERNRDREKIDRLIEEVEALKSK